MTRRTDPDFKGRRVLVVDDDRDSVQILTDYVAQEGHVVTHAYNAEEALHRVRAWKPHLLLLDVNMPGASGLELIPKVRSVTADDYAAIVLISANLTIEDVNAGMNAGADDYLTKPFRAQELLSRMRAMIRLKDLQDSLRRANHRIEELMAMDDLSGLMNMRALYRRADEEILRCRRFRKPISALLVDLDRFRSVNESSDFLFGSQVLKEMGHRIRGCVRNLDLVGRIGADQFFVLLVETDLAGAEVAAERIREAIRSAELRAEKHQANLTACIGVAGFSPETSDGGMAELFRNADEALRGAKASGSNKIEIYTFA